MTTTLTVLTLALPWLGALLVWLTGDRRPGLRDGLAVGFATGAGLVGLGLPLVATGETVVRLPLGAGFGDFTLVPDGLGALLAATATGVGALTVVFSLDYMRGERGLARYYALVLLFVGAMAGLVLTGSLLVLLLFWEVVGLCSFALIAFHADEPRALAGGVRALVMTQIGGLGLLAGVLAARGALGSYEITDLLASGPALPGGLLAFVAFGFLLAAAAKSAQVPFHTWLPAAMEAPTPISALIHAATMVNAGVYLLLRFYPAFDGVPGWREAVVVVGALSALLAGLAALQSTDLKRALAYSTVSQLGVMFYAVGVGALAAGQLHLLSHALFKALLFLGAGAVIHTLGTRELSRMGQLGRAMPFTRNVFVAGGLALAGVPFFNGFWSKELVLEAGLHDGPTWAFWTMLAVSGLTALYTTRLVVRVFFGAGGRPTEGHDAGPAMRVALAPLALATATSWLLSWPAYAPVLSNAATLLGLAAVAAGAGLWWARTRLPYETRRLDALRRMTAADFGFERVNGLVAAGAFALAATARRAQPVRPAWGAAGVVAGLAAVLLVVVVGGPR